MGMHAVDQFIQLTETAGSVEELMAAMAEASARLGFQYFALTHHVDLAKAPAATIRIHNYPAKWAEFYDDHALGVSDPVHRASHVTSIGFRWSRMPEMIRLTAADRQMLAMGRDQGIGDGFTVPANVPGEARGSCSFANEVAESLPEKMLPFAQLVGAFAFECARRLVTRRTPPSGMTMPLLTDRQRECVMWAARGKSDWEISRILKISHETVIRHIKQARERYGVEKRTLLAVRTLFDGTLTFDDIIDR